MAKGSKSKKTKSKTTKKNTAKKNNTSSKKKTVKKVSEEKVIKEEIKKEPVKEEKIEVVEVKKVVKEKPKKKKKKIITKNTIIIFLITLGFIGLLILLIISNKDGDNVSFVSKNGIKVSSVHETFKAPVYFYTLDKKDNITNLENVKFEDSKMTYRFDEATREEIDDGNVLFTIPCDMEVDVQYTETDEIEEEWHYDYSYAPVFAFDYYTGDVYLEKDISDSKYVYGAKEETKKDKKKKTNTIEMEYTNISYITEKHTVGIINNLVSNEIGTAIYQGRTDEGKNYTGTIKARSIMYIKVAKDYDGVMLAISKKGIDETTWKQENEKEENKVVYRLLDKEDASRKDYTKDDFYVVRVSDMFKENYNTQVEESDIFPFLVGVVALVLAIITSIAFLVKEIR